MCAKKIQFKDVTKKFIPSAGRTPTLTAVSDIDFEVRTGEFVAIVGPSGCGKSTLLNLTAGLMRPSSGTVVYDDRPVSRVNTKVGYVTQRDNLLPWRNVYDNVAIALEVARVRRSERRSRVAAALTQVGLTGFEHHYPTELSGGMRKRVTLARTLVYGPETLLMDEPFGALDSQLKQLLQEELLRIWTETKSTVLFVTHDLEEAVTLADRVVAFTARPGRIRGILDVGLDRPRDVFGIRFDPRFREVHAALWELVKSDVHKGTDV